MHNINSLFVFLLITTLIIMSALAKVKLTYFNIAGAAEKVRLAFALKDVPFDDNRIPFPEWSELKPKTKFGQLPIMTLPSGEEVAQSDAMLRYVATLPDGPSIFPTDPHNALKVDEVLGLAADVDREWAPSLYIAMAPERFGYPTAFKNTEEHKNTIKAMRDAFMTDKFPTYIKYYEDFLGNGEGFICGPDATIADCVVVPQLYKYMTGNIDYVSKDVLDRYPKIIAYMKRFAALPGVKKYEDSKAEGVPKMTELYK